MHRAELVGPPGVGKSTIFLAACAARNARQLEFMRFDEMPKQFGGFNLWPEFCRFVDSSYSGIVGDIHDRRHRVTQRAIRRARKIHVCKSANVVLMDEHLCQRGLSLALSRSDDRQCVIDYFDFMPVPAVAFVVRSDAATVKGRNAARYYAGVGNDRSSDVDACLAACGIAADRLRRRGAEIVDIDATQPVSVNVGIILDTMRARS